MKLKVTQKGVYDGPNELPVGKVLEVDGDTIPASLINKVVNMDEPAPEETPVEPVVPTADERATLLKNVAIELGDDDFTKAGAPKLDAVNAEVEADAKFDADEVKALWGGIAGTVEAERAAKVKS